MGGGEGEGVGGVRRGGGGAGGRELGGMGRVGVEELRELGGW